MPSVAIWVFEGISPFHLSVPCTVFGDLAHDYQISICADTPSICTSAGFTLQPTGTLDTLNQADIVIIPSWHAPYQPPNLALAKALQMSAARGTLCVGLCLGAYALAAVGLLDGKAATTHWAYCDDFKQRFPAVLLDADVLYVETQNIITSAGTAAAIDCCLHIIRQQCGAQEANRIARLMVTPPQRSGGQAQFIERPIPDRVSDTRIAQLMDNIRQQLDAPHTLDSMAAHVMMSRRSFTRHFQQLTHQSPGQWLLQERLHRVQQLLESSILTVDRIAELTGFATATTLRHHFKASFGVSPSHWRKTFAAEAPPLSH